VVAE
jgi:hypothetical protein